MTTGGQIPFEKHYRSITHNTLFFKMTDYFFGGECIGKTHLT